jgi:hypothetical protein
VITGDAVDAALHGIDEEAAVHGCGGDASSEVQFRGEGALGFLVGDKLDGPEEAKAADIADYAVAKIVIVTSVIGTSFAAQRLQGLFEVGGGGAGDAGICGGDQVG